MKNVELQKKIKYIDVFFLCLGIIGVILQITHEPPKSLEYIPDAVRGLTTLASILVGFIGFFTTHSITTTENMEFKKWLRGRVIYTTTIIAFGLLFLAIAYVNLADGNLVSSYKWMMVSLVIIIVLFLDTITPFMFEEEA